MSLQKTHIHFSRIYYFVAALLIFWILLELRLFQLQVQNHDFYEEQSSLQSAKKVPLKASRGSIYDRNGEHLATNLIHYDLGLDLSLVKNRNAIAHSFAKVFNRSAGFYINRMKRKRDFVYLARKVDQKTISGLKVLEDPGMVKVESFRRYYPFGKYGSQLIGFTDVDDKGVSGLELQYQKSLAGENGWTFLMVDARRRFGYNVDLPRSLPRAGANIILTIDKNYQTIIEDALDAGMRKYNATYGMAVMMNPHSGEILALYSSPGFNPNNPGASTIEQRRNRVITDIFEPGSTFKVFPAAALLQEKIKKPDDIVFCENGSFKYYDHVVNDSKKYGWLSFKKVIENSSNIGMVKLIGDMKKRVLYRYLKNFGFDSQTGINLIGESSGILSKPEDFSGITKGVISFGQEVGVTALQITNAFSAIINGGYLMRPYVIKQIFSNDGENLESNAPLKIRRVISAEVAQTLKIFMRDVVRRGTGKQAAIEGEIVGGKSGTAQKFDMAAKRYIRNQYLSSFIGFAPFENPQYVLAIFLDSPKPRYYGGEVAGPIFASIMKHILNYSPTELAQPIQNTPIVTTNYTVPDLNGFSLTSVEELLDGRDLSYSVEGSGEYIVRQNFTEDELNLVLGNPKISGFKLPNFYGMTIREALRHIDYSNYRVTVSGSGRVKSQSIPPGAQISGYRILHLTCSE
jgi:cell division protein FtsI/penicillin-binding protein 2